MNNPTNTPETLRDAIYVHRQESRDSSHKFLEYRVDAEKFHRMEREADNKLLAALSAMMFDDVIGKLRETPPTAEWQSWTPEQRAELVGYNMAIFDIGKRAAERGFTL